MLKKLLSGTLFIIACFLYHVNPASATCSSLPYVFQNGISSLDANATNANNQTLRNCAINIDNSQIGAQGFFASQLIPTNALQGTFGGASNIGYTFPGVLTVDGNGVILGTLSAPTINATSNTNWLTYPASTGDSMVLTTNGLSNIAGISNNDFAIYDNTTHVMQLTVDSAGDLSIAGTLYAPTITSAGQITGNNITANTTLTTPLITDTSLAINSCVGTNGSSQLNSSAFCITSITPTSNQLTSSGGANPTLGLATNPVIPGASTASQCLGTNSAGQVVTQTNCVQYLTGTSGQINVGGTGPLPVLSIPTNPTLPGTTTVGNLTDSGLSASNCIATNGSKTLVSVTCGNGTVTGVTGDGNNIGSTGGTNPEIYMSTTPNFTSVSAGTGTITTINNTTLNGSQGNFNNVGVSSTVTAGTSNATNITASNQLTGNYITANTLMTTPNITLTGVGSNSCVNTTNISQLAASGEGCPITNLTNYGRLPANHTELKAQTTLAAHTSVAQNFYNSYISPPYCQVSMIGSTSGVSNPFTIASITTSAFTIYNSSAVSANFEAMCFGY